MAQRRAPGDNTRDAVDDARIIELLSSIDETLLAGLKEPPGGLSDRTATGQEAEPTAEPRDRDRGAPPKAYWDQVAEGLARLARAQVPALLRPFVNPLLTPPRQGTGGTATGPRPARSGPTSESWAALGRIDTNTRAILQLLSDRLGGGPSRPAAEPPTGPKPGAVPAAKKPASTSTPQPVPPVPKVVRAADDPVAFRKALDEFQRDQEAERAGPPPVRRPPVAPILPVAAAQPAAPRPAVETMAELRAAFFRSLAQHPVPVPPVPEPRPSLGGPRLPEPAPAPRSLLSRLAEAVPVLFGRGPAVASAAPPGLPAAPGLAGLRLPAGQVALPGASPLAPLAALAPPLTGAAGTAALGGAGGGRDLIDAIEKLTDTLERQEHKSGRGEGMGGGAGTSAATEVRSATGAPGSVSAALTTSEASAALARVRVRRAAPGLAGILAALQ